MADFHEMRSLALDDDQLYDMAKRQTGDAKPDLPDYPPGLCFTVRECCFERLGIGDVKPGATVNFQAFARVISANLRTDGCRVELEIDMLKLGDGEFVELDEMERPSICLDENDHERLDLEPECDTGDMIHLIGTAKVVATDDNRHMGRSVTLQIEEGLIAEDEDAEAEETEDA